MGAHSAGRLFVAVDPVEVPIGFIRLELPDGLPHIEQVSVRPDHSRKGIGSSLMQRAEDWARSLGYTRMTLTTFRDVPWNGPFYSRLGWLPLPVSEWGTELVAIRRQEGDLGFDMWPRQVMYKDV